MHKQGPFRLAVTSPGETVPRMISGYGRACDGEWGVVLRPSEKTGVLAQVAPDGARLWQTRNGAAPRVPSTHVGFDDAVAAVQTARKALPTATPTQLRGQWIATLTCEAGVPVVELARKVAAYVVVGVRSDPMTGRWTWLVRRLETWAATPGEQSGDVDDLAVAISEALKHALTLAGEACSVRDVTRRASRDAAYAAKHPLRDPRGRKDNTDRFARAGKRKGKGKTTAPAARPTASMRPSTRLVVEDMDGERSETTYGEFARDNADAEGLLEEVAELRPGQSRTFGGGAAPIFTVTRSKLAKRTGRKVPARTKGRAAVRKRGSGKASARPAPSETTARRGKRAGKRAVAKGKAARAVATRTSRTKKATSGPTARGGTRAPRLVEGMRVEFLHGGKPTGETGRVKRVYDVDARRSERRVVLASDTAGHGDVEVRASKFDRYARVLPDTATAASRTKPAGGRKARKPQDNPDQLLLEGFKSALADALREV